MKTYLVTGASRGIGMAAAQQLIKRGHFVYGTYHTSKETVEALKRNSENLEMLAVNLADYQSIDQLVRQFSEIKLDGIVNSGSSQYAT